MGIGGRDQESLVSESPALKTLEFTALAQGFTALYTTTAQWPYNKP
jgi:hypothetical protein